MTGQDAPFPPSFVYMEGGLPLILGWHQVRHYREFLDPGRLYCHRCWLRKEGIRPAAGNGRSFVELGFASHIGTL